VTRDFPCRAAHHVVDTSLLPMSSCPRCGARSIPADVAGFFPAVRSGRRPFPPFARTGLARGVCAFAHTLRDVQSSRKRYWPHNMCGCVSGT
jgi:hypothetical protein